MLKKYPWIWKGDWSDIGSVLKAFLIAPIFILLPATPLLFYLHGAGGGGKGFIIFGCGLALLNSYFVTLVIGIPWFLLLSRLGYAGIVPFASISIVPFLFMYAKMPGRSHEGMLYSLLLGVACALSVCKAFWRVARKSSKTRLDCQMSERGDR